MRQSLSLSACVGLASVLVGTAGCSSSADDDPGKGGGASTGSGASTGTVTFHRDVEPILQQHCLKCHSDGQIGGFSLAHYDEAKPLSGLMVTMTGERRMPPFGAQETDECQPRFGWRDDPRLTEEEIAVFKAWADDGATEGDPAEAPPPFQLEESGLPNTDLELPAPETIPVSGVDDKFVCVVYDPHLTEKKYLDGLNFVAGNSSVAHHALIFRADRASTMAESGGASTYPCFGAPAGDLLNGWAPGGVPLELPATVGMALDTSDVIVVQMHYHPRDMDESDLSKLQLRFAKSKPSWAYLTALIGNAESASDGLLPDPDDNGAPEFRIPAGAKQHREEMTFTVSPSDLPIAVPILTVGNHMHYVGTDMKFSIERATTTGDEPADECMVQTPIWDFNWQRLYQFDTDIASLPKVKPGDTLRVRCTYDNTMENPFVMKSLAQQNLSAPQDVTLGETTLDEMCLAVVGILIPN